jgi:hypothetical protein
MVMSPELAALDEERKRLENEMHIASESEAEWDSAYKKLWAQSFLLAEGSELTRRCLADIAASEARSRWKEAEALRRSACAANESLTAFIHAFNRQLRVEYDLAGRAT